MKKILFSLIMALMLAPVFTSCSKNDAEEPTVYATKNEIQGTWFCQGPAASYIFEFDNSNYYFYVKSGKNEEIESGTLSMGGVGVINLTTSKGKTSKWSPLKAYWENSTKTALHLYPVGTFLRMK